MRKTKPILQKTIDHKVLLSRVKAHPKRVGLWLSENAKNGVNLHFSPGMIRDFNTFLDEAVDDEGNVDTQAMTGLELFAVIAGAASLVALGYAVGYAHGSSGSGTTVTVTENGDGDADVNVGNGGEGGEGGEGGNGGGGGERRMRRGRKTLALQKSLKDTAFISKVKAHPKSVAHWLDDNAPNGINYHFSPNVMREFGTFLDTAVTDEGEVDTQALVITGLELALALALTAVVAGGIGYAIGSSSDGVTITVTENGDGDVTVNCDGRGGDGDGDGGGEGGNGGGGNGGGSE